MSLPLEQSLDQFMAANTALLQTTGMPHRLWASIWGRIEANKLGTLSPTNEDPAPIFDVAIVGDAPCIVAAQDLIPRAAVVVYRHEWTFETIEQARAHLEQSPALVAAVSNLFVAVNALSATPSDDTLKNAPIEYIINNLHRITFSFTVASSTSGKEDAKTFNYVCLDQFSPAVIPVSESATPMLSAFVFVDQRSMTAYTVLYPGWIKAAAEGEDALLFTPDDDDEDTIPAGTVITRSPLLAMKP
ncbi:hypothetical protein BJ741DRAFT_589111 [Chytriomyces cf. hyalinus JEL632]|nr:hypothetical protein BJ741DRAFT_589111 [Chytriomyces cf. hyalinus JEL632]